MTIAHEEPDSETGAGASQPSLTLPPPATPAIAIASGDVPTGSDVRLSEPRPNPTSDGARLTLRVDVAQTVRAELFDVAGRRVASVYDGAASPGAEVTLSVSGTGLPAGVYVVRVVGETFQASRRLVLTR